MAAVRAPIPLSVPIVFLSTETELLDKVSVSLDVGLLEIIQHLTSLTYEAEKRTARYNVLLVLLHVLREVIDTVGK
jgi:hypothetical protein